MLEIQYLQSCVTSDTHMPLDYKIVTSERYRLTELI